MATIYYSDCQSENLNHICEACSRELDYARVRSIAFIKGDAVRDDLEANPDDAALWQQYIADEKVIIIPEVNGSFDGGSENMQTGFGSQNEFLAGYNFSLTYRDPDYKVNGVFYNTIKRSNEIYVAFTTKNSIHFSESAVQAIPKNPISENTTDAVVWEVTVNWSGSELSVPYDIPANIFECFNVL